jgi:hypothetical protein
MSYDFPLNGAGNDEVTFAGWLRPTVGLSGQVFHIRNNIEAKAWLNMGTSGNVGFYVTGSEVASAIHPANLTNQAWTFVAGTYSNSNDQVCIYVREQGAAESTYTCGAANIGILDNMGSLGHFAIGASVDNPSTLSVDASLDEVAIFGTKAMNQAELDGVFTNGWGGAGW